MRDFSVNEEREMKINFPVILDGATGSELMKRGLPSGVCQEKWITENPTAITELQREYEAAGSGIVYAPTFGAIAHKLSHYGLEAEEEELNRALVDISKTSVSDNVLVAADLAASGLFLAPYGDETMESLVDKYSGELRGQGEADIVVSETNMTVSDARAAVIAAKRMYDKPIFVTFTVDENGRTMTGADAAAALVIFRALGVAAFGFNCGAGPAEMLKNIEALKDVRGSLPLIAKPNAGLPVMVDGKETYEMSPEDLASYAEKLARAGVRAFGGCCGTTPSHIKALAEAVSQLSFDYETPTCEEMLATERVTLPVSEVILSDEIECSEFLLDDLMDCEQVCPLVRISRDADIACFEENQHAAALPVCIVCDDSELLSRALMSYNGRAGVKSTAPDAKEIADFYGAYILD